MGHRGLWFKLLQASSIGATPYLWTLIFITLHKSNKFDFLHLRNKDVCKSSWIFIFHWVRLNEARLMISTIQFWEIFGAIKLMKLLRQLSLIIGLIIRCKISYWIIKTALLIIIKYDFRIASSTVVRSRFKIQARHYLVYRHRSTCRWVESRRTD